VPPKRISICCLSPFLFLLASLFAPAADQPALESQMRQLLKNNILALRMPYTAGDLKFDAQGKLIGTSNIGPWTIYSSVQISDVSVKDSSFELDGERVILVPSKGKGSVLPMLTGRKVHISLGLTAPADEAKIRAAVSNIFSEDSVEGHFSAYWKPAADMEKPCKAILKEHPDGVVGTLESENPVYGCVKSSVVKPPKATFKPAPGAGAKNPPEGVASLRIVIDEHGYPVIIAPKTSSTPDYGIAALVAVSQWTYSPAMKDGKPVPFMMDIDVGNAFSEDAD
jgi:hypothetical protein